MERLVEVSGKSVIAGASRLLIIRDCSPRARGRSFEGNSLLSHCAWVVLVNCCAILVNGHECQVISQGDDGTEFEKRLRAELLESSRMISIDNCEGPLGGPAALKLWRPIAARLIWRSMPARSAPSGAA
jgi:hypothetical protein